MISRKTARAIAEAYVKRFEKTETISGLGTYNHKTHQVIATNALYDFLYDRDGPAWFCNAMKKERYPRSAKEYIMQLHTGESLVKMTENWTWQQREQRGQELLVKLAEDILNGWEDGLSTYSKSGMQEKITVLTRSLELDGYLFRNGQLLAPEEEVLDTAEAAGVLESLYTSLGLAERAVALNHLALSEEYYQAGRWTDCITNSRNFLEAVLREVAAKHSQVIKTQPLADDTYKKPFRVREYLRDEGLIDEDEMQALAKVYGVLSGKGSHPYMAANDQARLLRHMALIFSQFVLLRLDGLLG